MADRLHAHAKKLNTSELENTLRDCIARKTEKGDDEEEKDRLEKDRFQAELIDELQDEMAWQQSD